MFTNKKLLPSSLFLVNNQVRLFSASYRGRAQKKYKYSISEYRDLIKKDFESRANGKLCISDTISLKDGNLEIVKEPTDGAIPTLADNLRFSVVSPGDPNMSNVHPVYNYNKDNNKSSLNIDEYYSKIHSVDDIDHSKFGSFTPCSRDINLATYAKNTNCNILGSTSSVSGLLSQYHFALMGEYLPQSSFDTFSDQINTRGMNMYAKVLRKAAGIIMRKRSNNIWGMDGFPNPRYRSNEVLVKLGTQLEAMLTMNANEFEQNFLLKNQKKSSSSTTTLDHNKDAYLYSKMNNLLLRSQLDCIEPNLKSKNKVFDVKTRAVLPIRLDPVRYKDYINYRIIKATGPYHSFEKEQYDIYRTILLKYYFQARIGNMNGVLIAYHNTNEMFGFQHMTTNEMGNILFNHQIRAEIGFNLYTLALEKTMNYFIKRFNQYNNFKVISWVRPGAAGQISFYIHLPAKSYILADDYDYNKKFQDMTDDEIYYDYERALFHVDQMSNDEIRSELAKRNLSTDGNRNIITSRLESILTVDDSMPSPSIANLKQLIHNHRLYRFQLNLTLHNHHGPIYSKKPLFSFNPKLNHQPNLQFELHELTNNEKDIDIATDYRHALESYRCHWSNNNSPRQLDIPMTPL